MRWRDYCTGTSLESQRKKVEGTATLKSMFTRVIWTSDHIYKTTVLRLTISETPPFLWTPEMSCLGIPVRWDKHILQADPSIHLLIHQTPFRNQVAYLRWPLNLFSTFLSQSFVGNQKAHWHRKKKFAVRGDSEHRIRRHRGAVRVWNSVWTKFLSPTVRSTLVFPYNSYR